MIKKYSSAGPLEIEVIYSKIMKVAQEQITAASTEEERGRWLAALDKMKSAHTNSQILNMVGLADEAGNKIKDSYEVIKDLTPDQQDAALGIIGAVGKESARLSVANYSNGKIKKFSAADSKKTFKHIDRFMTKYSKLKIDEERFLALKKVGAINDDALFKIGWSLLDEQNFLKFAEEEGGGVGVAEVGAGGGSLLSGWGNRLKKFKDTLTPSTPTPTPAAAAAPKSWWDTAFGLPDDVAQKVKSTPGLFGKIKSLGLRGIGAVLKSIAKWWTLINGLMALAQMTYIWFQVTKEDLANLGMEETWGMDPLWDPGVLNKKLKEFKSKLNSTEESVDSKLPEKFGSLGYICELGRNFWDRAAGGLSAFIETGIWTIIGLILSTLGPFGVIIGIFAAIIATYMGWSQKISDGLAGWLIGGSGHGKVSEEALKIIEIKAGVREEERAPVPTGPRRTTPTPIIPVTAPERKVPAGEKPPEDVLERSPIKFKKGKPVTVNEGFNVIDDIKLGVVFKKRKLFGDSFVYAISDDGGESYYFLARELNPAINKLKEILGNRISKTQLQTLEDNVRNYQEELKKKERNLKRRNKKSRAA